MKVFLIRRSLILLFMLSFCTSWSQNISFPYDSAYSGNFLKTEFLNDINLSGLTATLNYDNSYGRIGLRLTDNFQSNVSKLERNYFRDFNNFKATVYYKFSPFLNAGGGYQNIFLTDDKNIETNQNNSNFIFSNFDFYPLPQVSANLRLGYKNEEQIGEFNSGISGVLSADAVNYYIDDYLTNAGLILAQEDLGGKKSHDYDISANVFKAFTGNSDNTGIVRFYNRRNDFYFPASSSVRNEFGVKNNIETRAENYFYVGDALNYRLNDNAGFSINGGFSNRIITKEFKYRSQQTNALLENNYDSKINENNLELAASLNFFHGPLSSTARMFYVERSENHNLINAQGLTSTQIRELENAEKNKNNISKRTGLLGEARYRLSNTNAFSFAASASMLRYDTDFDENYDDRDELEVNLYAMHDFTNLVNFDIQTKFDYLLSTISYIFSQRSANNNKNRIYRLSSLSNFRPIKNLITRNYFQVLANYTVYDFEDIVSQVQSFSYRQLSLRDSTYYMFLPEFAIGFIGELKIYEQGQFNNDAFSVKPINYFQEQFYSPELSYLPAGYITVAAGFRYFRQDRYRYDESVKILSGIYESYGPYGKIILLFNNASIVNFTGGFDFIKNSMGEAHEEAPYASLNLYWNM